MSHIVWIKARTVAQTFMYSYVCSFLLTSDLVDIRECNFKRVLFVDTSISCNARCWSVTGTTSIYETVFRLRQSSSSVSIPILVRPRTSDLTVAEILFWWKLSLRNDKGIFHPLHPSTRKWYHTEKSWILGIQDLLYGSWRPLWPFKLMILWNFLWNFWLEIKFWKQFVL